MTSPGSLSWNLHGNDQLSAVLEKLDRTLDKLSRSLDKVTTDARQAGSAIGSAVGPTQHLGNAATGTSSKLEGLSAKLSAVASRVATFGTAFVAAAALAVGAAGTIAISTASANEQASISFELLLGSAQKAAAFLAELQKFAAATPFEMPQLRTAASRLLAVGVATKDIIPLLTALGDATAGMGTGAEGIERAVTALTQMRMKTKVSAEEMLQLTEAGIPAWQALAAVLKTDVQTAMKMVEQRQVDAGKVFEAIETKAGPAMQRLSGMMQRQSGTLAGIWSTFKDNAGQALAKFAEPLIPSLKKIVEWAGEALPAALGKVLEFARNPEVQQWFKELGADLKEVGTAILPLLAHGAGQFFDAIKDNKDEILIAIKGLAGGIGLLVAVTVELGAVMVRIAGLVVDAWRAITVAVMAYVQFFLDAAVKAFGWIPGIGQQLKEAQAHFTEFRMAVNEQLGLIQDRNVKVNVSGISGTQNQMDLRLNRRAGGGPTWAGQVYQWQEQGKEYMVSGQSGRVMSNEASRSLDSSGGNGGVLGLIRVIVEASDGRVLRDQLLEFKRTGGLAALGLT